MHTRSSHTYEVDVTEPHVCRRLSVCLSVYMCFCLSVCLAGLFVFVSSWGTDSFSFLFES